MSTDVPDHSDPPVTIDELHVVHAAGRVTFRGESSEAFISSAAYDYLSTRR